MNNAFGQPANEMQSTDILAELRSNEPVPLERLSDLRTELRARGVLPPAVFERDTSNDPVKPVFITPDGLVATDGTPVTSMSQLPPQRVGVDAMAIGPFGQLHTVTPQPEGGPRLFDHPVAREALAAAQAIDASKLTVGPDFPRIEIKDGPYDQAADDFRSAWIEESGEQPPARKVVSYDDPEGEDDYPELESRLLGLVKLVPEGGLLPRFHGMVRYNPETGVCTTMLVGLNLLARAAWRLWVLVKVGNREVPFDSREAYYNGYHDGQDNVDEDTSEMRDVIDRLQQELGDARGAVVHGHGGAGGPPRQ